MNSKSKKFLIAQIIAMFVAVTPPLIGLVFKTINAPESWITNALNSAELFFIPLGLLPVFLLVSIIVSFIPSKEKVESPITLSLITEALILVWGLIAFLDIFTIFDSDSFESQENSAGVLVVAVAVTLVAMLAIIYVAFVAVMLFISARIHAITYTIHNLHDNTFDGGALVTVGLIMLFLFPFVGQILILIYEKQLEKKTKEKEVVDSIEEIA